LITVNIKIITYNAKSIGKRPKRCEVFKRIKDTGADIVLIQETHSTKNKEKVWYNDWGSKIEFSHGDFNARGACICFKKGLNYKIHNKWNDKDGRIIILDITMHELRFTLANIYAPNQDTPQFFKKVHDMVGSFKNTDVILSGDFNLVQNVTLDKKGGNPTTHFKCQQYVHDIMKENDWVDVWRRDHEDSFEYTWKSYNHPYIYCRLDFFLLSRKLANISYKNRIVPGYRSDHEIVECNISISKEKRGRGFWKLNCKYLNDIDYVTEIEKCIDDTVLDNAGTADGLMWEIMKCKIRGSTIKFCSIANKKERERKYVLENRLELLKKSLPSHADPVTCAIEIQTVESALETIIKSETMGARLRSKIQDYEEGEKSSKYFYSLEKKNQEDKTIKILITDNGNKVTSTQKILDEEVKFYEKLYTSSVDNMSEPETSALYDNFIQDLEIPKQDGEDINVDIDEEMLEDILKSFACGKSPGSDGLPIEFYRKFWTKIKPYLIASYKYAIENNELSITQKQGVITLIPKKDKDPKYIKNWRPITLLNTDYKILTKYIAEFLKIQLENIIHKDQKGFLKGRFIGENINNVTTMIDYANENNINLTLVFLDYQKAFDCVEFNIIEKCLISFGFEANVVKLIKCIYNKNVSCIVNNGHISRFFNICRGLRQGCPLSPYLFILIVELLAIKIRQAESIQGIKINNCEYKLNQYADDTFVSIINDGHSLNNVFTCIESFSKISGLQLNKDKTEILDLGGNYNCKPEWVKAEVKLLGIKINKDVNIMTINNFANKLQDIENCLQMWQMRHLSLIGRIQVIKSLATSKLIHCWSTIPSPDDTFFVNLDKLLYKFVWNSNVDRIKRNIMIAPYHEGGLNMIDTRSKCKALKVKWLNKFIEDQPGDHIDFWQQWLIYKIQNMTLPDLLKCNLNHNDLNQAIRLKRGSFWYEAISEWCKLNYDDHPIDRESIMNQCIWYNSHLKIGNKTLFYKTWYDKGVRYIKDIFNEQGHKFMSIEEIKERYNIDTNFLEYGGLQNCIPKRWKVYIKNGEDINEEYVHKVERQPLNCKYIYNEITKCKFELPEKYADMWKNRLNVEFDELYWMESYIDCHKWTINTTLRSFYFQFRMDDMMTNHKLYKMKIKSSSACDWCKNEHQNMLHLFWECQIVSPLWTWLEGFLNKTICNNSLKIEREMVFLYDIEAGNYTNIINLLVLITARYIYVCKCLENTPHVIGLHNRIIETEKIERSIAGNKGKIIYHTKKWNNVLSEL